MNPAVEKFMEAMKVCGYTPEEIRSQVRKAALSAIFSREHYNINSAMHEMSLQELLAIADEMKEGGES